MYIYRELENCEATNIHLQEHSSECLHCHIKGKAKHVNELVKVQSVLCEDALCVKRIIVVWRFPL